MDYTIRQNIHDMLSSELGDPPLSAYWGSPEARGDPLKENGDPVGRNVPLTKGIPYLATDTHWDMPRDALG